MKAFIIIIILLLPALTFAQDAKDLLRKGNKQYEKKKFNDAEISYRKSLEFDNKSHKAVFNLGDALYKQKQYDKASQEFTSIANQKIDEETTSMAYHNLGNSLLKSNKYEESIDAFKQSLRMNPKDRDTKYNLEYAKSMLHKQQQNKNQNKQDKQQQQQQQNQDKKNKDKKNQDKQQQQNQQNQQDKQKDQKQSPKDQKMSKKDAERMLQALAQEEKNLQKKLKKKIKGVSGSVEKEW